MIADRDVHTTWRLALKSLQDEAVKHLAVLLNDDGAAGAVQSELAAAHIVSHTIPDLAIGRQLRLRREADRGVARGLLVVLEGVKGRVVTEVRVLNALQILEVGFHLAPDG